MNLIIYRAEKQMLLVQLQYYGKYSVNSRQLACLTMMAKWAFHCRTILRDIHIYSYCFLLHLKQSENFVQFMVKWNVIRWLFAFCAIIYVCAEMDHVSKIACYNCLCISSCLNVRLDFWFQILTVTISSFLLIIDWCASVRSVFSEFSIMSVLESRLVSSSNLQYILVLILDLLHWCYVLVYKTVRRSYWPGKHL